SAVGLTSLIRRRAGQLPRWPTLPRKSHEVLRKPLVWRMLARSECRAALAQGNTRAQNAANVDRARIPGAAIGVEHYCHPSARLPQPPLPDELRAGPPDLLRPLEDAPPGYSVAQPRTRRRRRPAANGLTATGPPAYLRATVRPRRLPRPE